jgi:DNA-binding MarR family transcriptional regulator
MVKFRAKLDDRKFYLFLLKLHGIENIQLTEREIQLASYLLASDIYPFSGRGRRKILKEMGITSANFSILLKGLTKKGVVIKSEDHNDYSFSTFFDHFKKKWEKNSKVELGYIITKK